MKQVNILPNQELVKDFARHNYPTNNYFNSTNCVDLKGNIIFNATHDITNKPFEVKIIFEEFSIVHCLNFNNKYAMLNFLLDAINSSEMTIMAYSNIGNENINKNTIIEPK